MIADRDKKSMKEFCKYLQEFEPYYHQIYKNSIICFDNDNPKVFREAYYRDLYDAFLSGQEVVIYIHDRGWHSNAYSLFLDRVERPVFNYTDSFGNYLLEDEGEMLFITIENEFDIKRCGVLSRTSAMVYKYKKEDLHTDIYMAIKELLDTFKS